MPGRTLAMDFGTSNSAAAILDGDTPLRLPIESGAETLPTAVFFPADRSNMRIGAAAAEALIEGEEGRYMRALKSVLGTALFHESRLVGGRRRTLADIVTAFIAEVRRRAEAAAGRPFTRALSGRPVHFHTADPERDARAEADLRACYLAAGFEDVRFMFEPEAAALASHGLGQRGELGLIVDIGGGTSDFSVFRAEGNRVEILASHGIRLGGTDFDHAISMAHAMPHLGHGGQLRRSFGEGLTQVPNAIYVDLSTWAKIPFVYAPETLRLVRDMVRNAVDPQRMGRLETVIEAELGHELAFAVEAGKISANGAGRAGGIDMGFIEPGLSAAISAASLDAALAEFRGRLRTAMEETLRFARVAPQGIGSVILVGGSSLMDLVSAEARAVCPEARLSRSEAFTAVVDGLALATAQTVSGEAGRVG
ncbi:Hsp70 family protein [Paroceanicella profunda]|uniref:Hsp70 family protein n=1 Tax=Paroceanicella profunda TaxID=2579971 RepID=A0A5B8FVC9_9RHOB|nr:Hsp70 family protein [Paroceanicella profunda]QDL90429.1 Hsp70 family protein [Paroceanicella profunda]